MRFDMASRPGCEALCALLVLSRELLQAHSVAGVLDLAGHAVSDLTGASLGLAVVRGEHEYVVGFDLRGRPRRVPSDHALYRVVSGVFAGACTTQDGPVHTDHMLLMGVPARAPMAAFAASWEDATDEATWEERCHVVQCVLELAVAALARVEERDRLEQLVLTQYGQIADSVGTHAAELKRRDLAEGEMRILSLTDLLTGLNNRRGFFEHADPVFQVAQRRGEHSAVIFADIDGLKTINDDFGHEAGDRLIRDAATVFRDSFRGADVVARLGGDEFVAYTLDEARPEVILGRLQNRLDVFNLTEQRPYRIAVSTGIVRCDPQGAQGLERYIQQADQQMYAHKRRRLH